MAPSSDSGTPLATSPAPNRGRLIALLAAVFYGLFTLLPDSSSLVLSWPWVFLWQAGLLCPVLWLLVILGQGQGRSLQHYLDGFIIILVLGLGISSGFAEFPLQARWSSWAVLCAVGTLYALSSWCSTESRRGGLLTAQGYLGLAFVGVSLLVWSRDTLLPELTRLNALRQQYGVALPFSFDILDLRNWAPLGHPNLVAGYLVLLLPLWMALATLATGRWRWLWWSGVGLGLLDIYTTGSRAPLLGLAVVAAVGLLIGGLRRWIARKWLAIAATGILGGTVLLLVLNPRLRQSVSLLWSARPTGNDAYRLITQATGWQMGLHHPWTGIGLGGVPLTYQRYRPIWAGREAELTQQLHSTPVQLWAELGIWAVIVGGGAIAVLTYLSGRWLFTRDSLAHRHDRLLIAALAGLLAYGVVSLTDYQLDVPAIAGTLLIYLAVLIATLRDRVPQIPPLWRLLSKQKTAPVTQPGDVDPPQVATDDATGSAPEDDTPGDPAKLKAIARPARRRRRPWKLPTLVLPLAGLGVVLAMILWLIPIHRAWMLSSQGFLALRQDDLNSFAERLNKATQLAPGEPYYPYQLAWNLSDRGLGTQDPALQLRLLEDGIDWFEQANRLSPYQEFGHTNVAWLRMNQDPAAASQEFGRSAKLVPAKRGVFYGLGVSLLLQGKKDWATTALTLEALRDPTFITSPVWQIADLQPLLKPVLERMEARYTQELNRQPQSVLWHQLRGGLRWWRGDLAGAQADLEPMGNPVSRLVLAVAAGKSVEADLAKLPESEGKSAIAAWLRPTERPALLRSAWIWAQRSNPPPAILQQLVDAMERSTSLDQWLKQNAPSRSYRRERAGFGVLSRHIDGPLPIDFLKIVENIPLTQFFGELLPRFLDFVPELDQALQPDREALLAQIMQKSPSGAVPGKRSKTNPTNPVNPSHAPSETHPIAPSDPSNPSPQAPPTLDASPTPDASTPDAPSPDVPSPDAPSPSPGTNR